MGWVTVIAYAIATVLCFQAARRVYFARDRAQLIFWSVLTGIMLFLGVNKQLDLQTWFTLTAKKLAVSEGWYNHRRPVQLAFICFVFCAGMAGFWFMSRLVQRHGSELWLPLLGLFLVTCFVIVRAASFHHIDQFLKYDIGGMRMNWLLELGGISIVAVGALAPSRRRASERSAGLVSK